VGALSVAGSLAGCARGDAGPGDEVVPMLPVHAAPPAQAERDWPDAPPECPPPSAPAPITAYPKAALAVLGEAAVDAAHTQVLVYGPRPSKCASPIADLEVPVSPQAVSSLAFDDDDRLYVLEYSGRIQIFASGASGLTPPEQVFEPKEMFAPTSHTWAQDLAFDTHGNLYVAIATEPDYEGTIGVAVYGPPAAGNVVPTRFVSGPSTGLVLPVAIDVDAQGNVYVGDYMATRVTVFGPDADGDVPPARVAAETYGLGSMAVGRDGRLFVAPEGIPDWSVRVFSPPEGPDQVQKPEAMIMGPHTGFSESEWPIAMAVAPDGELAVIGPNGGMEWRTGANGDAAPLARFGGWNAIAIAP
jgi:hypothetical protein